MKYIVYNDVFYLFQKKKRLLFSFFLIPLLFTFLYRQSHLSTFEIVKICVGANFDITNFDVVSLLMLLFNTFYFIYFIIDIYAKDLNEYLENIWLRIKPIKYIVRKNIIFVFLTSIIKFIQYMLILFILLILGKNILSLQILQLFAVDIIYVILLEYLFFVIYLIYILCKKNITILLSLITLLIAFFPKNIWNTKHYTIYLISLIIVTHLLINLIFLKKPKKLIEEVSL